MFLIPDTYWEMGDSKEKGRGIFCKKSIVAGTVISDYLGKIIDTAQYDLASDKRGLYLMYFSDERSIYPDLTLVGPHLFNHSCRPNCWIKIYRGHTLFFALRAIKKGEELTISYLLDPDSSACSPCTHICKCHSINCSGTMHLTEKKYVLWHNYLQMHTTKERRSRSVVGENLLPLSSYPSTIPYESIYTQMLCQE